MQQERLPGFRLQGLALAYHVLGQDKESDAALNQLIALREVDMSYQIAEVYAFRGQADLAFQWLERAYLQRDGGLTWIKGDPLLRTLARDARYAALLNKLRLPLN